MLARFKKHLTNTKQFKPLVKQLGDFSRDKIEVKYFVSTDNVFVRLLAVYLLVLGGNKVIVVFKEVLFIMMLLIDWFGLKIKSL